MWAENSSQFSKAFIEDYNKNSGEGYFLRVDDHYPEKLHDHNNGLPIITEKNKNRKS